MWSALNAAALHGREVAKQSHLSLCEEIELGKLTEKGDKAALEELVLANLWLVEMVARKYRPVGMSKVEQLDLMQEGYLGLLRAAQKYDWRRGFAFSTYAFYPVKQAVLRGRNEMMGTVRLPVHVDEARYKIKHLYEKGGGELPSSIDVIAAAIGESEDRVKNILYYESFVNDPEPLDGMFPGYSHDAQDLSLGPEQEVLQAEAKKCLRDELRKLTQQEARVLALRFGLDGQRSHTRLEIGMHMQLTESAVSSTLQRAFRKLRQYSSKELLSVLDTLSGAI